MRVGQACAPHWDSAPHLHPERRAVGEGGRGDDGVLRQAGRPLRHVKDGEELGRPDGARGRVCSRRAGPDVRRRDARLGHEHLPGHAADDGARLGVRVLDGVVHAEDGEDALPPRAHAQLLRGRGGERRKGG